MTAHPPFVPAQVKPVRQSILATAGVLVAVVYVSVWDVAVARVDERVGAPQDSRAAEVFNAGVACIKNRRWGDAITNLSEAIRIDPRYVLAYDYRGCAYLAEGDLDKAIVDFTAVIRLDPGNAGAYLNRGGAYRIRREFDKALSDLNECLRRDPTNVVAYKARAWVYESEGEPGKAIADCSQCLLINSKDAEALLIRAKSYSKTRQYDRAINDCTNALRLDPRNPWAHNDLAWLRATCPVARVRNGKEAIEAATSACELTNWGNWEYIDTLAGAFAEAGDFEKAVKYQEQAIQMRGVADGDRREMAQRLSIYKRHRPYHASE